MGIRVNRARIAAVSAGAVLAKLALAQQRDEAGIARAEALLVAMGGGDAWSKVKFVHVGGDSR